MKAGDEVNKGQLLSLKPTQNHAERNSRVARWFGSGHDDVAKNKNLWDQKIYLNCNFWTAKNQERKV